MSKVFISYAQRDSEAATQIRRALEGESFQVFDPAVQIFPGDNFARLIGEALENSDAMVTVISPAWFESSSARSEVSFALASRRYQGRLIPVVLGKDTLDSYRSQLPPFLSALHLIVIEADEDPGQVVVSALLKAMRGAA